MARGLRLPAPVCICARVSAFASEHLVGGVNSTKLLVRSMLSMQYSVCVLKLYYLLLVGFPRAQALRPPISTPPPPIPPSRSTRRRISSERGLRARSTTPAARSNCQPEL